MYVTMSAVSLADPSSRLGLSRERIVEAAMAMLDGQGTDSVNMRALADRLGVGTMTLYGYFRSKDELLDAIVDSGARRIARSGATGSWKKRLRELVLEIRRAHLAHPAVVELRLNRPLLSEGALEVTERGMSILRAAGFSKRDAARAYRSLFIFTFGFSAFAPSERGEVDREASRAALSHLPADRYPVLLDSADEASEAMADQGVFEFALDRLLDGLEQLLRSRA
jgi:AcrR family transcriptional regulator